MRDAHTQTMPLPTFSGKADAELSPMRGEKNYEKVCPKSSLCVLRSMRLKTLRLPYTPTPSPSGGDHMVFGLCLLNWGYIYILIYVFIKISLPLSFFPIISVLFKFKCLMHGFNCFVH